MKKLKFDNLTQWFLKLSASDRRAVTILVIFLLTALMYYMTVWSFNYRKQQISSYENNQSLTRLLNASALKFTSTKGKPKFQDLDKPLLTLVSTTAKDNQIVFKRFQPDGENVLKLWMENINFNNMLLWLHDIDKKNGISVEEISVEQSKEEGFVDVRLTLKR